jgi:hypothetical protein
MEIKTSVVLCSTSTTTPPESYSRWTKTQHNCSREFVVIHNSLFEQEYPDQVMPRISIAIPNVVEQKNYLTPATNQHVKILSIKTFKLTDVIISGYSMFKLCGKVLMQCTMSISQFHILMYGALFTHL